MVLLKVKTVSNKIIHGMRINLDTSKFICRYMSSVYRSLVYDEFGDPTKVLKLKLNEIPKRKLENTEVFLKCLMSPINPADINLIQGVYAVKPSLPSVGGLEGICEVAEVGPNVQHLKVGSWVIPKIPATVGAGMWVEMMWRLEDELFEVRNDIPVLHAATMAVNPCTAYRMLKDFIPLKENDTVIQNASNSGVGIAVIQIAKHLKINTINLIRSRENEKDLKDYLKSLGATYVFTEKDLKDDETKKLLSQIPKAKLSLNAVGGKSTIDLCKYMAKASTMVTYGGMSKQPLMVPVGSLIFNDISVKGYWMTRWVQNNAESQERSAMMDFIQDLISKKLLLPPKANAYAIEDYETGINMAMMPFVDSKQVFIFDEKYKKDLLA